MLCGHHMHLKCNRTRYPLKKAAHLCLDCNKEVDPIITYPAGNKVPPIKEYPIRCYKCRKHQGSAKRSEKYRLKMKEEHLCMGCKGGVEQIIIYPAGDKLPPTKRYPIKCYECREKGRLRRKSKNG